jgi:DNA polymerase II small subunit
MNPSKKLRNLVAEGYQLTPEAFSYLNSLDNIDEIIDDILSSKLDKLILSKEDIMKIVKKDKITKTTSIAIDAKKPRLVGEEPKKEETPPEKKKPPEVKTSPKKDEDTSTKEKVQPSKQKEIKTRIRREMASAELEVLYSPKVTKAPASADSFRRYFDHRYQVIRSYFSKRRDITNRVTTSDLNPNKEQDKVSLIAIVTKIQRFNSGTVSLELEDPSGQVTGIIYASNQDLVQTSQFILEDSVLCFTGRWKNGKLSVYDVLWPDIPFTHKPNHASEEILSLHVSDIHVGSKEFAGKLFHRVINFINGQLESEKYNKIGEKVKYLFVAGDVVDGVGVYPGQKDDLVVDNIQLQYHLATEYFDQIRKDVEIIIIPGNHDGARSAEPQTPIQKEFAQDLLELDNVHLFGSPCYLKTDNVEVLLNHGNSIIDINAAIPAIPHETSIPAMREMLKNRHLVPIYGKRTPIAPAPTDDLIISRIPDIFHTGHTHIAGDDKYKGVLLLNSGTFQYQTSYQKSMNINPTTGLTYVVNMKKLERSEINFQQIN